MGLFDKFKKKTPEEAELLPGKIEKEPSVIAVIPKHSSLPENAEQLADSMLSLTFIKVVSKNVKDSGAVEFILEYMGEEYKFAIRIDTFELPELYTIGHDFTDEEIDAMRSADRALYTRMIFGGNNCASYHLQIKLMCALVGDPAGVADISGERILAGRWVKLAAKSDISPAPMYLYCVQCISGEDDDQVWLHTHGLNRCGGIELEILNSDKENYKQQAVVINTLASRIITENGLEKEYDPIFAVRSPDGGQIVTTWVRWQTALKLMPKKLLGSAEDRIDGHNENTGVLFVYPSPKDFENKKLVPVSYFNKELSDNPMMMISNAETQRMRSLAIERYGYLKQLFNSRGEYKNFAALVKIGLEVDEQYKDGDMKEHIWFELKELHEDGSFSAELTQEPYYVEALKPGDIRSFTPEDITDWVVYTDESMINPDSVYRMEK